MDDTQAVASHADMIAAVAEKQDRAAFRALFDHFAPRLMSFMIRRGADRSAAEEIVQETMVKVWRKAANFDPAKAAASTWIFTIARNAHIDTIRKASRPEIDPDDPTLAPESEPDAATQLSGEQDAARVRAALNSLPEEQHRILTMAFFEDKPHRVIADELDIPLGTVKSRIRLAFKRMRAALGDDR